MKIPGIGETKPTYVYIGVGVAIVGVMYWRKKNAAASAAAAASVSSAGASTDSGIDPSTGLPYADETSSAYGGSSSYGGYGGIDPATGVPYIYESGGTGTTNTSGITTDSQWAQQAEGDLVSTFGYSLTVAQSAVTKYMGQSLHGLNDTEYEAMSAIIAELGPPPKGSFRLIHAPTSSPPGGGGGNLPHFKPGQEIRVQYNVQPGQLPAVASRFGISVAHILGLPENAGKTGKEKVMEVYYIPYQIQPSDTFASVASKFGISESHLAEYVSLT